ncbi:copper chaperone PCu(A)C [Streptosporangium longisporum]|uniref:Copper chaperone PCu(A)C n=1 Tax=Streptosporangium longisporum TaxID=46187 RepID=A0ABN3XUL2_9ACTN
MSARRTIPAPIRRAVSAGILIAAVTVLGACGSEGSPASQGAPAGTAPAAVPSSASSAGSASPAPSAAAAAGATLTITDPWVKTAPKGMSAAFGTLVNPTDTEVTVVSGASPLSPMIELHEVVESGGKMIMRPKEGGFVIPPRGTHRLQPGGDHIMLMGVTEAVKPGARIPFTLTLKGGGTLEFTAIGKEFAGGKEDYEPGTHAEGDKGDG